MKIVDMDKSESTSGITVDTFFDGRMTIAQAKAGYRFSIDAVILAHHVMPAPEHTILDLGSGCGIIPLILAYRYPGNRIFGVELQDKLAALARANIASNRLDDRVTIFHHDMKTLPVNALPGPVDIVVTNPPYRRANAGRINPGQERALARHEIAVTLAGVVETAGRMLQTMGRFTIIYPAERGADLMTTLRQHNIEPKYLRTVHSHSDGDAKLIIVEAIKNGNPGLKIAPPLVIYGNGGGYTEAVSRMFTP